MKMRTGRGALRFSKLLTAGLLLVVAIGSACSGRSRDLDHGRGSGGSDPAEGGQAGFGEPETGGTDAKGGRGGTTGAGGSGPAGEGGRDDSGGTAGSAGGSGTGAGGLVAGAGGSSANAGAGGAGGRAGAGGSGVTWPVPTDWGCSPEAWDDGHCHCGCGVIDMDCHEWTLEECEVCDDPLSCSGRACPGKIDPDLVVRCQIPIGWVCSSRAYDDGRTCDCGCGIPDPDCANATVASCDVCDRGCSAVACPGTIAVNDNTTCTLPQGWNCPADLFGDGACDCGCGARDFDCVSGEVEACDRCSLGCAEEDCPATIAPDDNAVCDRPPPSWRCEAAAYADGALCHCGCGVRDPDCRVDAKESCDVCDSPGSCSHEPCAAVIRATDTARCIVPPLPPGWTCSEFAYADSSTCDCGCGARDFDCGSLDASECDRCPYYSCAEPSCETIDPADNAHCSE
ncbi:MAG TPA: hypothetical protein VFZ53_08710 [Polyangiaceae bacterium]